MPFSSMSGPDLVKAYNELAPKLNFNLVKRFKNKADGVRRCEKLAQMVAALAPAASPRVQKAKPVRASISDGIHVEVVVGNNPKRAGSRAARAFAEMTAYLKSNPGASLGAVIENTSYRMSDYGWDLDHKFIRKV